MSGQDRADYQRAIEQLLKDFQSFLKARRRHVHSIEVEGRAIVILAPFRAGGSVLDWKRGREVYRLFVEDSVPPRFLYELADIGTRYLADLDAGIDDEDEAPAEFVGEDFDREFEKIGTYFRSAFFRSGSHVLKGAPFRG